MDWISFLVLDLGTPAIEDIPVGTRIIAGLLQSVAVRAAGFAIVPLNSLAPAVKVLYLLMMYISVYPIAMTGELCFLLPLLFGGPRPLDRREALTSPSLSLDALSPIDERVRGA